MDPEKIANDAIAEVNANVNKAVPLPAEIPKIDSSTLVSRAEAAALALKTENDRSEALLKQHAAIHTRQVLGGQSEAGIPTQQKTSEQIVKEEANAILKRAGLPGLP